MQQKIKCAIEIIWLIVASPGWKQDWLVFNSLWRKRYLFKESNINFSITLISIGRREIGQYFCLRCYLLFFWTEKHFFFSILLGKHLVLKVGAKLCAVIFGSQRIMLSKLIQQATLFSYPTSSKICLWTSRTKWCRHPYPYAIRLQ